MKKIFKGIGIYTVIAFVAFVAIGVFCAGFLFFYRKANIFGFRYVSGSTSIYAKEESELIGIENIKIDAKNYPINIHTSKNAENLTGVMVVDVSGYTNKKLNKPEFSLKYNKESKTAVFTCIELNGWFNVNGSKINITLPQKYAEAGLNFEISTSKGNVYIGGDDLVGVGDLDIESRSGDVILNGVEFVDADSKVSLVLGKGDFNASKKCKGANVDFEISTDRGEIDLTNIDKEKLTIEQVKINKLTKGKVLLNTIKELITTENINGGGKVFVIEEVENVNFISLDTDVNLNKITNLANVFLNGLGDIVVNEAYGESLALNVEDGDILVKKAYAKNHIINSNYGNVNIKDGKQNININSVYGNITVYFNEEAEDWNQINKSREINAVTKNGSIYVEGLQRGNITATNNGKISLKYNKVCDNNIINSNNGAVNIVVPDSEPNASDKAFNLKLSTKVNPDIRVGVVEINESGEKAIFNIYNNSTNNTENTLSVSSTSGVVKIRSLDKINM